MHEIPCYDDLELAARLLRAYAEFYRPWDGTRPPDYRLLHEHTKSGLITCAIYSRDTGHHSSGWFKNPDYERCYHLTISFHTLDRRAGGYTPVPYDRQIADKLTRLTLGDSRALAWMESAKLPEGQKLGIVHWRVFCDPAWQPIHPRGEVYTRDFTEKGWQSWSEQHPTDPNPFHVTIENPDR